MATLTNKDINNGVVIIDRGDYPEAKLILETGVSVSQGDLIQIVGRYTSEGVTNVVEDTDGYTVNGTKQFKDNDATFQTDNVAVNDVLWIKEGIHAGFYTVVSVDSQTQITTDAEANFTSTTSLTYEIWIETIFKGRVTDTNFEKVRTILCEDECESDIDAPIETDFYCGRLGGLIQELLDNECAFINHDFTQTSPYNYRAPHNFRNDSNGAWTPPEYWNLCQTSGSGTLTILASLGGHKKVLEMYEPSGSDYAQIGKDDLNRHYDIIEGYVRFAQTNQAHELRLDDGDGTAQLPDGAKTAFSGIRIKFDNDGNIKRIDGRYTSSSWITIQAYSANTWYKIKIKYDINNTEEEGDFTHDWHLWIDDVEKSPGGGWEFYGVDGGYDDMQNKKMQTFYFYSQMGGGGQYAYFDAFGSVFDNDYILGVNASTEYNELIYTSEWAKYPMTEKTNRQYFNSYALKYTKIWYLDPDYLIHIDDGDTDSLIDINASSNVSNVDGKKQVKAVDKVVIKCGIVDGVRIIGTYGTGDVLAKDTHAHILDTNDANDMAEQIYNQQSAGILKVALDYENPAVGYIQVGEEVTIVGNTIRFKKSDTYICSTNTQFKIRSERLQLGPYGQILYNELYLDDVLIFQISSEDETQKATEENSQLISEVGAGGSGGSVGGGGSGESNQGANIGDGEGEVFKEKIGVTLYLKTLKEGNGITLTNNTDDVTLAVDLENPPTENEATKAPTSEWAFDHDADGNAHHNAAHTLASHSTKAHSELSDAPTNAHHNESHTLNSHSTKAHSELSDAPIDAHHNEAHVLATTGPHSAALPWTDLNKTGSDLGDLASRTHSDLSDAPTNAHHNEAHQLGVSGGPHTGELPLADLAAGAQGDIIKRGAADWEVLTKGTEGYGLRQGANEPIWAEIISNTEYDGAAWNGVTTIAPSKNAVRDVIDPLTSSLKYSGTWLPGTDKYPEAQVDDVDGSTNVGSPTIFTDTGANFSGNGVLINDILNIREGTDLGFYVITAVGTDTVTCGAASFSTATGLEYQIFRAVGGEYWICNQDGYYDSRWFENGDWLIWNDTEIQWDRIRNSFGDNIISVAPGDDIQIAIDEIESIGEGTIRLLPGTHTTSATLTVDSAGCNITIEGFGFATVITPNANHDVIEVKDADSFVIKDLTVNCIAHTVVGTVGILIYPTSYPTFQADKMIIDNCYVYGDGTNTTAIQITGMHGAQVRDCIIADVAFGTFTNADRGTYINNYWDNCIQGIGINLNADYTLIVGNTFVSCTEGIEIQFGSDYTKVVGNHFSGCTTDIDDMATNTIIIGDDTAYNATSWDGNMGTATKNAIRDKFESLGSGDADAIHDNVANEITAITLKATPVSADELIIEDSAASYAKKSITIGSLPKPSMDINDIADVVISGTPADNEVLSYDSGSTNFINQTAAEAGLALASALSTHISDKDMHPQFARYWDQKASGTDGGTFTLGAWRTRDLNQNDDPTANIIFAPSSNRMRFTATGYYLIIASAPHHRVGRNRIRMYNQTTAQYYDGVADYDHTTYGGGIATLFCVINVTSTSQYWVLQHRSEATQGTNGFGVAASFGSYENYAQVIVIRLT